MIFMTAQIWITSQSTVKPCKPMRKLVDGLCMCKGWSEWEKNMDVQLSTTNRWRRRQREGCRWKRQTEETLECFVQWSFCLYEMSFVQGESSSKPMEQKTRYARRITGERFKRQTEESLVFFVGTILCYFIGNLAWRGRLAESNFTSVDHSVLVKEKLTKNVIRWTRSLSHEIRQFLIRAPHHVFFFLIIL